MSNDMTQAEWTMPDSARQAPIGPPPTYEQGIAEGLRMAAKAASDQSALPVDAPAFSSGDYAAGYTSGAQTGSIRAAAAIRALAHNMTTQT